MVKISALLTQRIDQHHFHQTETTQFHTHKPTEKKKINIMSMESYQKFGDSTCDNRTYQHMI